MKTPSPALLVHPPGEALASEILTLGEGLQQAPPPSEGRHLTTLPFRPLWYQEVQIDQCADPSPLFVLSQNVEVKGEG